MKNVSLKKITAGLICIHCALLPIAAQSADAQAGSATTDETAITLADGGSTTNAESSRKPLSSVLVLLRVILVLAIVCAAIYGVVYLMKRSTGVNAGDDPYLKSVAAIYFSPNKSIQVITLGEKAIVVGVTDQNINYLSEVSDPDLVNAMNLQADKRNPVARGAFQSVLSNFLPGFGAGKDETATQKRRTVSGRDENDGVFSPSAVDLIRSQRERLRGEQPNAGDDDSRGGAV